MVASSFAEFLFTPWDESLKSEIKRAARTDKTISLRGPTGTGKTVLARLIHEKSNRKDRPFIALNCANLPDELVESELFGHRKGAFTGAVEEKVGLAKMAHGGTLFFDEIGNGRDRFYHSLLKFLVDKEVRAVGENVSGKVDVRVICATDASLESKVGAALMRRLTEAPPIRLPQLSVQRQRKWFLFREFVNRFAGQNPVREVEFLLWFFVVGYFWPQNIGQLKGFAEYLIDSGSLRDGRLYLDREFRYFDESARLTVADFDWECYRVDDVRPEYQSLVELRKAAIYDDDPDAGLPNSKHFKNSVHRNFAFIVRKQQNSADQRAWRRFSKGRATSAGRWEYPFKAWSDPWLSSQESCIRVGDALIEGHKEMEYIQGNAQHPRVPRIPWTDLPTDRPADTTHIEDYLVGQAVDAACSGFVNLKSLQRKIREEFVWRNPNASERDLFAAGMPRHATSKLKHRTPS